jgi:hypothetical protein
MRRPATVSVSSGILLVQSHASGFNQKRRTDLVVRQEESKYSTLLGYTGATAEGQSVAAACLTSMGFQNITQNWRNNDIML